MSVTTVTPIQGLKLHAPKIRGRLVIRARVLSLLDFDPDRSMVIVCAPAGYGKSTAVAQWLSQQDSRSIWLTVDRLDQDPRAFLTLLVKGLQTADPDLVPQTSSMLETPNVSADSMLGALIEDFSHAAEPTIVVVDDYHLVDTPDLNDVIAGLALRLPWQLRLVLITHKTPSLPLARLRASGELLELGPRDLQFDLEETSEFLSSRGHQLAEHERQTLYSATEGWIAALNLASLAIKRLPEGKVAEAVSSLEGSNLPWLSQYLWQEVLGQVSGEMQAFLYRVAILDRFTVDLCNYVLNRQDSAHWITICEGESLFLTRVGTHRIWFRFHHLFLAVLREQLHQKFTVSQIRSLHARAWKWYQNHGFIQLAVHHALAAGDLEQAAAMLETACNPLFAADRISDLFSWLKDSDPSVLACRPRLAFYLAWAHLRLGHLKEADEATAMVETIFAAAGDSTGEGLTAILNGLRAMAVSDNQSSVAEFHRAIDILSAERSKRSQPDSLSAEHDTELALASIGLGMALSYQGDVNQARQQFASVRLQAWDQDYRWTRQMEAVHSGYVLYLQGELRAAAQVIGGGLDHIGEHATYIWVLPALTYLGLIALEQDQLEDSEGYLEKALRRTDAIGANFWRARTLIAQARLLRAQGRRDEVIHVLRLAGEEAFRFRMKAQLSEVRAIEGEIALASRDVSLADRWVESSQLILDRTPPYEFQAEHLAYARYLISTGHAADSLGLLTRLRESAVAHGRIGQVIEIDVVSAIAQKEMGNTADAIALLEDAVSTGSKPGFAQVYLKDWDQLSPLFRTLAQRGQCRDYAAFLVEKREGPPATSSMFGEGARVDGVSPREIEVLRLVALGKSNREIGEILYISEKTVKKHVSNIMAKLGTSNRTQTADYVRTLNLL